MKAIFALAFITLIVPNMYGQDLSSLKWEKRVIIISALPSKQAMLDEQLKELRTDLPGLEERKLLVLHSGLDTLAAPLEQEPERYTSLNIPDAFINPAQFQIVLIGLDGTEKKRYLRPVTCEVLFAKIDAMPMRHNEIKDNR